MSIPWNACSPCPYWNYDKDECDCLGSVPEDAECYEEDINEEVEND